MLTVLNVAYPFAPVGPDAVGGAEQVLSAVDHALNRVGHRSLVVACEGSRTAGRLFAMPRARGPLTERRRSRLHAIYRARIQRILREEAVDVVHLHGVDFAAYLPEGQPPALVTLHLPPEFYPPVSLAGDRPQTHLVAVSDSQRRRLPGAVDVWRSIGNGVDLERFAPAQTRGQFALVLSRICPEKGVHLAMDAARRARVPLLVGGEVFPYLDHQAYFAREIAPRLGGEIRFVGPVGGPHKARLLAQARCLVVPSLVPETSSLVTMEALAAGTPVVAFARGALPSLIDSAQTGFLVGDVDQMAEAIQAAGHLPGAPCRRAAEARFPLGAMTSSYLDAYAQLARRRRRAVTQSGFRVEVIDEPGRLTAIADAWHELWQKSPRATVFQRPEWLLAWCAHLLAGQIRCLALWCGESLVGLGPFFRWQDGGGERVLSLMGAGVSDYQDVLVDPAFERPVLHHFERWLRAGQDCRRVFCSELRQDCRLLRLFGADAVVVPQDVCPGIDFQGRLGDGASFPLAARGKLAYARRRAARDLGYHAQHYALVEPFFDELERLHATRWRARDRAGAFGSEGLRAFHRDAAHRLSARGVPTLHLLYLGGKVAAALYGFRDRQAVRYYIGGFDTQLGRYSPGALLLADVIEQCQRAGFTTFDFLRGAEPYKYSWGAWDREKLSTLSAG